MFFQLGKDGNILHGSSECLTEMHRGWLAGKPCLESKHTDRKPSRKTDRNAEIPTKQTDKLTVKTDKPDQQAARQVKKKSNRLLSLQLMFGSAAHKTLIYFRFGLHTV